MQLDGGRVSEDGVLVVLIHKQRCVAQNAYVGSGGGCCSEPGRCWNRKLGGRGWLLRQAKFFSPSVTSGLPFLDGAERMESSDFVWVSAGIVDSLHFRGAAPKIRGRWSLMDREPGRLCGLGQIQGRCRC